MSSVSGSSFASRASKRTRDDDSVATHASVASSTGSGNVRRRDWLTRVHQAIQASDLSIADLVHQARQHPFQASTLLLLTLSRERMVIEIGELEKEETNNDLTISDLWDNLTALEDKGDIVRPKIEKLEKDMQALANELALLNADYAADQLDILEKTEARKTAKNANKGLQFARQFMGYLTSTEDQFKVLAGGVSLETIRGWMNIRTWEDILAVPALATVHAYICALAVHGMIMNHEFRNLWVIRAHDQQWRIRNHGNPNIKTGRLSSKDDLKQRVRLADYIDIVVPEEVIATIKRFPSEITTVREETPDEQMAATLESLGYIVQPPTEQAAAAQPSEGQIIAMLRSRGYTVQKPPSQGGANGGGGPRVDTVG